MSSDEPKETPVSGNVDPSAAAEPEKTSALVPADSSSEVTTASTAKVDDPYGYYYDDPYSETSAAPVVETSSTPPAPPPPPETKKEEEEEPEEDDGMLRMSFLEHLEELRTRIIRALAGFGVAFVAALFFAEKLWLFVQQPAEQALRSIKVDPPRLVAIDPMDQFSIIWMKLPILTAVFLASPWVLYQVWGFIAPGLYKRERRWAAPFVLFSAGLFLMGGAFAYFIAFRYGLAFLLGIGRDVNVMPMVSMVSYFDLFVNVMLGVSLLFELPVLIFFLTLLRIVTPGFLIRHSRYAILLIVVVAAIITPTPDIFNLMMFATPMCVLFYIGIFASYLLVLGREGRKFPWRNVLLLLGSIAAIVASLIYFAMVKYGYKLVPAWPFLTR
ncbi:MAG: twin-arginine translocase subunit TatC [Bryobacteraceae bacterium]